MFAFHRLWYTIDFTDAKPQIVATPAHKNAALNSLRPCRSRRRGRPSRMEVGLWEDSWTTVARSVRKGFEVGSAHKTGTRGDSDVIRELSEK